ncbi:MAG TPA: UDP-N-acetylglucosamine 1-carboxyvinyltransferase [Pirellulales bacterium]|jgi:UDP-N-acetylglucosamine 1-carboxyvinyltransferase|nr:UDP-N-acetylglucosamine 1-carboxyvinyltransferase [Pirellulales bacterium]
MFTIQGGKPLSGTVQASGSKNAALPIMAASLLAGGEVRLQRVPQVADVDTLALLLGHLGVAVKRQLDGSVAIATLDSHPLRAPQRLVRRMRASFCVLGPLLARRRRAIVPLPGGCRIGPRPVDIHLRGLEALGAQLRIERGHVLARCGRLHGAEIDLAGPYGTSVTGTANVLMAAVLARGKTVLQSAATEPEVVDLGKFLVSLGARIAGLGTPVIEVSGVDALAGGTYQVIPDRIEAGTLLLAVAICGGQAEIVGLNSNHLTAVLEQLAELGCRLSIAPDRVTIAANARPRPLKISARTYPGIPTDLQAQFTAVLTLAGGNSSVRDLVFPTRDSQVSQLRRMGARISRRGADIRIHGTDRLIGADVVASDLRASAALVLAGLAAAGETRIHRVAHLDRGYEQLEAKLNALGASVARVPRPSPAGRSLRRERSAERWRALRAG